MSLPSAASTGHLFLLFLSPVLLVLSGGLFVMADCALLKRRGDADGVSSFMAGGSRPRPGLRLASVFFFTLASVLSTKELLSLPVLPNPLVLPLLTGGMATILSFLILVAGILLPRAIGETLPDSLPVRILSRIALLLTFWLDPLADLGWRIVSRFFDILNIDRTRSAEQTEEEVLQILDEGLESGVLDPVEKEMVEGVLDLDDQTVADLMTPRSRVTWLDLDDPNEVNWRRIAGAGHSDYPVFQGNHDMIRGIVSVKSLWANLSMTGEVKLSDVLHQPLFVPSTMTGSRLIEEFRNARNHVALVVDEFGVVEGMVTLKDVVESIIGRLPERGVRQHYPEIILREDGSWLIDAQLDFEETIQTIGLVLPEAELSENRYQTIGGFVLHAMGHIPEEGQTVERAGYRFEVVDMDRQRVDKLLITRINTPLNDAGGEGGTD